MKITATKSSLQNDLTRCVHNTSHGHRCRMPSTEESRYCVAHARQPHPHDFSLANELAQAAGAMNSPEEINRALAKVFLAIVEDRIEPRKAYLLGFVAQTLLRTHHETAIQKKLAEESAATRRVLDRFECDFPSAVRDRAIEAYLAAKKEKELRGASTTADSQA